jgi:hypothetical protein
VSVINSIVKSVKGGLKLKDSLNKRYESNHKDVLDSSKFPIAPEKKVFNKVENSPQ